jgi:hypothetical protein
VEQMTLPLRHGGSGLSCMDPALASTAYLAAAAATHTAIREGPEAFRPFDGPSGALLRPQWEALHEGAGDLWKPELREVIPDRLGLIAEAQGTYMRHAAKLRFDALFASYDAGSQASTRDRAHLLSCACRPASARLDTLPLLPSLALNDREVQTALRRRLGLPVLPLNAPTVQCGCGATLRRSDADHAMRCRALPHSLRCTTTSKKGYFAVLCTGRYCLRPSNRPFAISPAASGTAADGSATHVEARGDILMVLPQGIPIADVSVVHPLSTRLLHWAASTARASASHRDQQQRTTYAWLVPKESEFVPVSVESYGRLSQPAMKLLHTLSEEAAGPGDVSQASFVDGALRKLSVGLVRGNCFPYRASVGMLAGSSGACFRPGLARPTDGCCAE